MERGQEDLVADLTRKVITAAGRGETEGSTKTCPGCAKFRIICGDSSSTILRPQLRATSVAIGTVNVERWNNVAGISPAALRRFISSIGTKVKSWSALSAHRRDSAIKCMHERDDTRDNESSRPNENSNVCSSHSYRDTRQLLLDFYYMQKEYLVLERAWKELSSERFGTTTLMIVRYRSANCVYQILERGARSVA